jgi:hypothetical protein
MIKKERVAPVALMFFAAGLSFLVCEEVSRMVPTQDAANAIALSEPFSASVAQTTAPAPTEQPRNFAQRIVQKINHAVHSAARSAELLEASTTAPRESGLDSVQPEAISANEPSEVAHGPLDLSLVPGVIVLPKMQEPLASAGLYDKRTHQKL